MCVRQPCLYCFKMYSSIGSYITHLHRGHKVRIVDVPAKQPSDDGSMIEHSSILLPFIHDPHLDPFLHLSNGDSNDVEANNENMLYDPVQLPVGTRNNRTPRLHNGLTGMPITNDYVNIFDDEVDLWSPSSCMEQYPSVHWCVMHNFGRAAFNELFMNLMIGTVSNITSSSTVFKKLNLIT